MIEKGPEAARRKGKELMGNALQLDPSEYEQAQNDVREYKKIAKKTW